jgi:hypothetical protein
VAPTAALPSAPTQDEAGESGKEGSISFLKKRNKKLLSWRCGRRDNGAPERKQKFFGSFSKKNRFLRFR